MKALACLLAVLSGFVLPSIAEDLHIEDLHVEDLHINVSITHRNDSHDKSNAAVVIWLTPIGREVTAPPMQSVKLTQKNKEFSPHLLVITAGTTVQFPNRDPFFHNVFSVFKGKRFDLGLYEAGSSRSVKFDHPGVSFIFCNIHPEMSASVVVLSTPYFAVSNTDGTAVVHNIPPGKYKLSVWYERGRPEELQSLAREISIPATGPLRLSIDEVVSDQASHKNKYGQDYERSNSYWPQ